MNKYLILIIMHACLGVPLSAGQNVQPDVLTVKHLGHTSFLITDQAGTVLVTDPFLTGFGARFPSRLSVDLVLVSASGPDHDAAHQLRGNPAIVAPANLSSKRVGDFEVEGFQLPKDVREGSGARAGYIIRHGETKLLFLGEIADLLPPALLNLGEEADAVLAGFSANAPAAKQLAVSPRLATFVPVSTEPGPVQLIELDDWPRLETDALEINPKSPRQVVRLRTAAPESLSSAAPDYSIFLDTLVELTWPQLQQAASEAALILVPVGVIEEHGPHMGLGADTYLSYLHCRRLKSALAALGTRALIAPPLYWGIADDTSRLPGSFNVRPETMTALITDLCRSLEGWGFRRLVFVNEHGNRNHRRTLLDSLAKVRQELDVEAFSLDAMMTGAAVYQARRSRYSPDYHAGAAETGVMWQEFPAEVDVRLAAKLKPEDDFLPLGYVGDPAGYRQEEALSDYLKQAPEYDARRILSFFFPKRVASEHSGVATTAVNVDSEARRVIERYIQAVGGAERLKRIQSQRRTGHLLEDGRTIPLDGLWSAEGKWALSLQQAPGVNERFGFTGSFGWHAERGDVGQLPEPLVVVISLALDPQLALRLTGLFAKLTLAERPGGERGVDVLDGETISGLRVRLAFDSATGLLVNFNDTVFEDYREVDGIKYPFAITVQPGTRARFERIENDVSLDLLDFEPPK